MGVKTDQKVVDLSQHRAEAELARDVDDNCWVTDKNGCRMYLFLLSWTFGGTEWASEVWAYDFDDAEARVAAMRATLVVDSQAVGFVGGEPPEPVA